jgi:hypothetical protein
MINPQLQERSYALARKLQHIISNSEKGETEELLLTALENYLSNSPNTSIQALEITASSSGLEVTQ